MEQEHPVDEIIEDCERVGSFKQDTRSHQPGSHIRHVYQDDHGTYYVIRNDWKSKEIEMATSDPDLVDEMGEGLNEHPSKRFCLDVGEISWDHDNADFGPEGVTVSGECDDCGAELEYYYDKTNISDPDTGELIREF